MTPRIPYDEIDTNIVGLVRLLNTLAGAETIASCGGHKGKLKPGQWAKGRWFVGLYFARDLSGWQAFDTVVLAMNDLDDFITLEPFANKGDTTSFMLMGERYSPERFARRLQEAIDYKVTHE